MKFEDIEKYMLRKLDMKEIVRSARFVGLCQCDRSDHDHFPGTCHRRLGPRATPVFRDGAPHIASGENVIVVCPKCADYIRHEKR